MKARDMGWKKEDELSGFYNENGEVIQRFALYELRGVPDNTELLDSRPRDTEFDERYPRVHRIDGKLYVGLTSPGFKETEDGAPCEEMLK